MVKLDPYPVIFLFHFVIAADKPKLDTVTINLLTTGIYAHSSSACNKFVLT